MCMGLTRRVIVRRVTQDLVEDLQRMTRMVPLQQQACDLRRGIENAAGQDRAGNQATHRQMSSFDDVDTGDDHADVAEVLQHRGSELGIRAQASQSRTDVSSQSRSVQPYIAETRQIGRASWRDRGCKYV